MADPLLGELPPTLRRVPRPQGGGHPAAARAPCCWPRRRPARCRRSGLGTQRLRHPVPPRARRRGPLPAHRHLPPPRLLRPARAGRGDAGDGPRQPRRAPAADPRGVRRALRPLTVFSKVQRMTEHVDVLIVGAGLSGHRRRLPAAHRAPAAAASRCSRPATPAAAPGTCSATRASAPTPTCSRSATAGGPGAATWRSPTARRSCDYLRTVAREYGVDELIRYRHRVVRADWDSETARWTVEVDRDGAPVDADDRLPAGAAPATTTTRAATRREFPGQDDFARQVVHPQHWPEDLDYAGKRVVVIGSGATAVTLVPAMARQRRARHDAAALADVRPLAARPRPDRAAAAPAAAERSRYPIVRWKSILLAVATLPARRSAARRSRSG